MADSESHACADCGVTITGVPVVPEAAKGPTRAQIEKLKPTVYLCTACAKDRGLSFSEMEIGRMETERPPASP